MPSHSHQPDLPVLSVRGARVHNLKNVSVDIPKNQLVVITGLSGSGKSSLAFDTIYAEGQRRYMESLSSYARQFLELQDKPDVDEIAGLSPTIAIDQKSSSHNPRSTVGTVTEIYDHLRVLFARAGRPHCPHCKQPVRQQTAEQIATEIRTLAKETDVLLLAPVVRAQPGEHKAVLAGAEQAGYRRVRFDGMLMDVDDAIHTRQDKRLPHTIELEVAAIPQSTAMAPAKLRDLVARAVEYGNGDAIVLREDNGDEIGFSTRFTCPTCHISLPALEPRLFSFNAPLGACGACTGLGVKLVLDEELIIPNPRLTIAEGAVQPWTRIAGNQINQLRLLEAVGVAQGFSIHEPVEKLSKAARRILLNGTGAQSYDVDGRVLTFPGVLSILEQKYRETDSDYVRHELEQYMRTLVCPECHGQRLRPEALAVTVAGKTIADLVQMSVENLRAFFVATLARNGNGKSNGKNGHAPVQDWTEVEREVFERIRKESLARLDHVLDVGLGYLTLDRSAMSLSGGESQRLRLATQLGSGLSGVIYILDEPSIGLHPRDNEKLIETMKRLRDVGNTVIVVEHDEAMIRAADHVIDVGPGAGTFGGEIIAQGHARDLQRHADSLTGAYLSGKKSIAVPNKTRKGNGHAITVVGATENNLKNLTVRIPLGLMVCVTGVSGSGKSTLILDILGRALSKHFYRSKLTPGAHEKLLGLEHVDKVVAVDQSPIGRTPRSNPATYTGLFTAVRDLFTEVPEAKLRGFDAGKFSFNVKGGGRCEVCAGDGMRRIEMQFLPDVYVECPECHGTRYTREVLEIHYKGKTISDVLNMTVEEARRFFVDQPALHEKLSVLHEVGLGYVQLGQSATTLSGGEAQRVKLATELSRRATGRTLYILDEPTTGLHFDDTKRLLSVLQMLVEKGNTVLMIEHNLDVLKTADWLIDLGPDGGEKGGELVAFGTPREIANLAGSVTGTYLRGVLH